MGCIGLTVPLFASIYLYTFYKDKMPNSWQVVGYVGTAIFIGILIYGNMLAKQAEQVTLAR